MNQQPQWYCPEPQAPAAESEHGVRVSDAERSDAITALGSHFAEGRLGLVEYEERVDAAAFAVDRRELDDLFTDLPALSPGAHLMPMYSAAEVARVRKDGSRPKAATMGLSAVAAVAGAILFAQPVLLLVIPAVFLLLYVAKVGPESWHMPSERKLEQKRLKAMRMEHKMELQQRRQVRRQQVDDLKSSAMKFAQRSIQNRIDGSSNRR